MPIILDNIQSALLVRIDCPYYKDTADATPITKILTFSDFDRPITLNSETYLPLGGLIGITASSSELRTSANGMTITIAGVPNSAISEIYNSKLKGSRVVVYRYFFTSSGAVISPGFGGVVNPTGRFWGVVNNYTFNETYDVATRSASNTIILECASQIEVLGNKIAGRRTNPVDQQKLYPDDLCFNRVPSLTNSNFNFGAPQ
jgi:hypothetical protein